MYGLQIRVVLKDELQIGNRRLITARFVRLELFHPFGIFAVFETVAEFGFCLLYLFFAYGELHVFVRSDQFHHFAPARQLIDGCTVFRIEVFFPE